MQGPDSTTLVAISDSEQTKRPLFIKLTEREGEELDP